MAGRLRGLCRLASAAGRRVVQNEAYSNNAAAGSLQQVPLRFELYSADFQAMTEEARVYKATYRQIRYLEAYVMSPNCGQLMGHQIAGRYLLAL